MFRPVVLFAVLATLVGCGKPETEPLSQGISAEEATVIRSQLLVAMEPPAAKTVVEVRDFLVNTEPQQAPAEVSVVGQVGGMPNPFGSEVQPQFPWVEGLATFFLVDPTTADKFEGHQHEKGEECSFCLGKARDLVDTVAMVNLRGEGSVPIAARADWLLQMNEGATAVVTGTARNELGMLIIDADSIYLGPPQAQGDAASPMGDAAEVATVP